MTTRPCWSRAVEAALRRRDKLRLLYLLGDDVTGFSAGAAWQDAKVGTEHVTRWEKIAVVTDKEWLRHSVSTFGYLIPGEIRAFPAAQEGDARALGRELTSGTQNSDAPGGSRRLTVRSGRFSRGSGRGGGLRIMSDAGISARPLRYPGQWRTSGHDTRPAA